MTISFNEHDRRMILHRLADNNRIATQRRVTEVLENIEFAFQQQYGNEADRIICEFKADLS
ncbi:MAG: hypothetical protein WBP22_02490 [Candidatus Saccharimonas sp.]